MKRAKLYACIVSADIKQARRGLLAVAREFAYSIEMLDDGILFDVSGLERLIGGPDKIAENIFQQLQEYGLTSSVAVAETVESACLLARQNKGRHTVNSPRSFAKLPLFQLPIEQDTLNVLGDLGIDKVEDLLEVPADELIGRYGKGFQKVLDVIEQKSTLQLTPNVKQDRVSWKWTLDSPVEDFQQLIFLLNRGLERLFAETAHRGHSTEHIDIGLELRNKTTRTYEIKTSFPTLERAFWQKLIHLRVSLEPPGSEIVSVRATTHFTKPRPSQRGLYAVSRPEPESLMLTVNKLKKMVGEDNVGRPAVLDRRLAEPFELAADLMPAGVEGDIAVPQEPSLAFTYYRPPRRAEVIYRDARLVFIRTKYFDGYVREYSGVWKGNSTWWDRSWKTQEWDVEVEGRGIYRLAKANKEWLLIGEYD